MKIVFRNEFKEIAVVNITNKTTKEVEQVFKMVFDCCPNATFEYVTI